MTIRGMTHHPTGPEPPAETVLTGGSPAGGDRVTLQRLESGWQVSYGGGPFRPCTYATVRFWGTLRVVAGPLVSPAPAQPSVPEEWLDDLEESA